MLVYRLSQRKYAQDLSGKGAELFGGRWNNIGNAMLYTAENVALCLVEIAVHTPYGLIPKDYMLITIEIPDGSLLDLAKEELPADWDSVPNGAATQAIGDQFIQDNQYLGIRVPSAVVKQENNILLNPAHHLMKEVKVVDVEPFEFDSRMFHALKT